MKKEILRIVDANVNRSREGLRVCEDVARFALNNKALTRDLKQLRHRVQATCDAFPDGWRLMINARQSAADVGRATSVTEAARSDIKDIFFANMQRSKESVRVLEEFLKLIDTQLSDRFKRIRFELYEAEKKALTRF